ASGLAIRREKAPSVGMGPGAIAFKRMPAWPHSTARERVIARTPAFAQAEGSANAVPVQAYVVVIDTIAPGAFRASRCRPTASVQKTEPCKTVRTTASKPLGVRSSAVTRKLP